MTYDIAVIGAGPAGLSAAINGRARNKTVLVVGNDYKSNPLYRAELVDNYLGMPGKTGGEMMDDFYNHAVSMGVEIRTGRVLSVMPMGNEFFLSIGSDVAQAKSVVIANGVSRGKKYLGEEALIGRGVSYCATCDGMLYRGKDVVVVGLAPDAPEEANFLQEIGCKVTYVSGKRPEELSEEIQHVSLAKLEVIGDKMVTALKVGEREIETQCVFLLRSAIAPTDLLPVLALDDGYIQINRHTETNVPGVFAAGDCTGLPLQVSNAAGEGLVAGQKAAEYVDKLEA